MDDYIGDHIDDFMAGALLREVARLHDRLQRATVACCGTTSTQCLIITTLGRNGPMTLADLGRHLALDKGWISRAVESLAEEHLLIKEPGGEDKRTIIVSLSETGEQRLAELDATLNNLSERVMQRISTEERAGVYAALKMLNSALLAESQADLGALPETVGNLIVSPG